MRGRESKGPPSGDFFFCFPRTHMTILPKPFSTPARPSEVTKRHNNQKKQVTNGGQQSSPLEWSQTTSDLCEPSSPRVTCGGQIRMRAKAVATGSRKNWESVMEEMEKLHDRKHKRKSTFGIKNDIMQFLTCLGRLKFGSHSNTSAIRNITSDEEERSSEEESCGNGNSETTFSKWFKILQEQQKEVSRIQGKGGAEDSGCGLPPNAMLLMRSRSVSATSWLEDIQEEEEKEEEEDRESSKEECKESVEEETEDGDTIEKEIENLVLEEEKRSENKEMMMRYDTDYYKLSTDIAKETWVVADSFSRDRRRKR